MIIDRRRFLAVAAGGALASSAFPRLSLAANPAGRPLHGLSAFGDLKYPPGFAAFGYANRDAPTGGLFNFQASYWYFNQNVQTFNTLNSYVLRGDAPPRMEMCFDGLMASAHDEPDAVYCHVAETVTVSEDGNRFTFRLRDIARFHDGTPITAANVKFSYDTIKQVGHPQLALPLGPLIEVIAEGERTVTLVFDGTQSAQAILSIAAYPIFSAAWHAGRRFDETTLDPPLGSGPYRVGRFDPGRFIEYERVPAYWGRQIGTGNGLNHFQTVRIEFFIERQAGFEAFKKGEIHWRREFTSRIWATEYNFPAVNDGRVIQKEFAALKRPSKQAWAINQRRARFADRRVREAIALCFDFEWTNANIFHGLYERSQSPFSGSAYQADGPPDADEVALIERLEAEHTFPEGIDGPAYRQAPSDGSGRDRARLRQATGLLAAAGWARGEDGLLHNAAGEPLALEILIRSSAFERLLGPFVRTMQMVGIDASIRLVDPAQFQARTAAFDFDMVGTALGWVATPTDDGLEQVFGSATANVPGSRNWPGLADPLVDTLIAEVGKAQTRAEHGTAMRVLDRVLRLRLDWIPNWRAPTQFIAWWDMFGFRADPPDYFWPVESLWWFDEDRAKSIGKT